MAKVITVPELAQIVNNLLLGEWISSENTFLEVVEQIAEAITHGMGGQVGMVYRDDTDGLGYTVHFRDEAGDAPLQELLRDFDPQGELD